MRWRARSRPAAKSRYAAGCARGATPRRAVLRQRQRRLLLRPDPGGGAEHAGQLRIRSEAPHRRLRGHRHRHAGGVAGPGPELRDPGRRGRSGRLGRGPGDLPDPAQGALAGVPARGRPPAPAHQHVRRGHPHPQLPGAGRAPLLPRERLLLDQHADHHHHRRRGRRADVPRLHAGHCQPAAQRPRARSTSAATSSARKPSSPCPASSTSRPTAWR